MVALSRRGSTIELTKECFGRPCRNRTHIKGFGIPYLTIRRMTYCIFKVLYSSESWSQKQLSSESQQDFENTLQLEAYKHIHPFIALVRLKSTRRSHSGPAVISIPRNLTRCQAKKKGPLFSQGPWFVWNKMTMLNRFLTPRNQGCIILLIKTFEAHGITMPNLALLLHLIRAFNNRVHDTSF